MGNVLKLEGMRFGDLVVIEKDIQSKKTKWICLCDCGNLKSILSCSLTKENGIRSCGCKSSVNRGHDLTGQKFGDLTVLRFGGSVLKNKRKRRYWICQCVCGKEVSIFSGNLKGGGTKSCGCLVNRTTKYNFKDLTGKTFGELFVTKRAEGYTKTRGVLWECLCNCGEIKNLPTNSLTSGNNITCGKKNEYHLHQDRIDSFVGVIPKSHISAIKNNATKRNLSYNISNEYLNKLFFEQSEKCSITGVKLYFTQDHNPSKNRSNTTASLDRIDSTKGYIEGNVRWVHKDINLMRASHNDKEFLKYCSLSIINNIDKTNKIDWHYYFLLIAKIVSIRSDDPNIKHGSVITTLNNRIIGTGYNGTIQGADIALLPLENRTLKREYMIHAEENAILNCYENPNHIGGANIYITGLPCVRCLQRIINFGIKNIIYIDRLGTITENEQTQEMREKILKMSKINIISIPESVFTENSFIFN